MTQDTLICTRPVAVGRTAVAARPTAHTAPDAAVAHGADQSAHHVHHRRMRALLKAHPELRALVGPAPSTAGWIACVLTVQLGLASLAGTSNVWVVLLLAYTIGAVLSLALWTLIHECSHDLVLRTGNANRWLGIVTGLPLVFPTAATFRTCHLMHHKHMGDPVLDGDIPSQWEVKLVGNCTIRKALWLLCTPALQSLRTLRMPGLRVVDRWSLANLAVQMLFDIAVVALLGWGALLYLLVANVAALGLHPLGARWIQEHFVTRTGQETYSYYGPMNRIVFNAGYHNEHHDLMRVPWMHLPRIRRGAPEFYDDLAAYRSWTALLLRFLTDRTITLASRALKKGTER